MAMVGIGPGSFLQVALRDRVGGVACRCLLLRERFTLWVPFRFESLLGESWSLQAHDSSASGLRTCHLRLVLQRKKGATAL
jgi:hypothetical protein